MFGPLTVAFGPNPGSHLRPEDRNTLTHLGRPHLPPPLLSGHCNCDKINPVGANPDRQFMMARFAIPALILWMASVCVCVCVVCIGVAHRLNSHNG